jgi:adenosylcobinamide-GDP ribazoletransferase
MLVKRPLLALQFLTVLPVVVRGEVTHADLRSSTGWYPIVGLMMGAALAGVDQLAGLLFNPSITVALMVAALVLMTGAFHLDGLADMADGLACKGDRARRLAVMRDGSAGPAGVVAIIGVLGFKFLALSSAANLTYFEYYFALLFMPVVGRWAMLAGMFHGRSARTDGLGSTFIGSPGAGARFGAATGMVAALLLGATIALPTLAPTGWVWAALVCMAAAYATALIFNRIACSAFGGQTGDTLGASGEAAEVVFLLGVIGCSNVMV